MIARLFEMIKSSRPFQDACHIVAEPSTLQLPMWQEMHKGLLCRSSRVHPTTTIVARNAQRVTEPLPADTVSFLGRPTTIFPLAIPVLLTAPQIPAGMTGFCWNGPESTGMRLESTGMGLESTGMNAFLQELITQQNKTKKILVINN